MSFVPLLPVAVALSAALSGAPMTPAPSAQGELDRAVQLFETFEDEKAAVIFQGLLKRAPPGEIAAKAHLYLGVIAFNAIKPDLAKTEFRSALEANPAIDLPRQTSPKARLAFASARHNFEAEMEGAKPQAKAAPTAATASPPAGEVDRAQASHSHVAAYVLGAVTIVLAGLAVYGGIEVLNYNSMAGAGNGGGKVTYSYDQLNSAHGPASFWAVGWPVAAGLGAAGAVGTALTW